MTTIAEEPLFMKDVSWYYYDEKERRYKLTDKAPTEAVISYKEFYRSVEKKGVTGCITDIAE